LKEKDFLQYVVGKQIQIVHRDSDVADVVLLNYNDHQILIRNSDGSESIVLLSSIVCISPRDTTGNFTTVGE